MAWDTANNAVLALGRELLISDPNRLEGVKVIWGMFPTRGLYLSRRTVAQALMNPRLVLPRNPLERGVLDVNDADPRPCVYGFVLVGVVDVFGQGIVVGIPNRRGRRCDSVVVQTLVVDDEAQNVSLRCRSRDFRSGTNLLTVDASARFSVFSDTRTM